MLSLLFCATVLPVRAGDIVPGDLSGDREVTAEDARLALRASVGLEELSDDAFLAGDIDGDNEVTAADARGILRAAVGLEPLPDEGTDGEPFDPNAEPEIPYEELMANLPTSIPEAPPVSKEHDTFTFTTYGNGDAVGLSQQGAIAMAKAGFPYEFISTYYFFGTQIVKDDSYPATVGYYNGNYGKEYDTDTEKLVARIVDQEIGGSSPLEAQKAQAIAVYTLLKYFDFNVDRYYYVGSVRYSQSNYERCTESAKRAARETFGQYLAMQGDPDQKAVLAAYFDCCAGRTLSAKEAWGGGDFPVSVSSPFEASTVSYFAHQWTCTSAQMRERILRWDPTVQLSDDPAEWFEILQHDGSLDADRGYVTKLRVGDKTLTGIGMLNRKNKATGWDLLSLRSYCFTVAYTP